MPSMGDKVKAGDFPATVWDDDNSDAAFTNTSYSATSGTPTLPVCGVAFVAPISGRVKVTWRARFECKTNTSRAVVSADVATGGTPGSGSVISGGNDEDAIETSASASASTTTDTRIGAASYRMISGLTPGTTYNAYTVHKSFSATGSNMYSRGIVVEPAS